MGYTKTEIKCVKNDAPESSEKGCGEPILILYLRTVMEASWSLLPEDAASEEEEAE